MIHHASPLVIGIITMCYLIFVFQIVYQAGCKRLWTQEGRAILSLAVVFIFCSLSGYVSDLFPMHLEYIREIMHWILATASIALVLTNQGGIVAKMLNHD